MEFDKNKLPLEFQKFDWMLYNKSLDEFEGQIVLFLCDNDGLPYYYVCDFCDEHQKQNYTLSLFRKPEAHKWYTVLTRPFSYKKKVFNTEKLPECFQDWDWDTDLEGAFDNSNIPEPNREFGKNLFAMVCFEQGLKSHYEIRTYNLFDTKDNRSFFWGITELDAVAYFIESE